MLMSGFDDDGVFQFDRLNDIETPRPNGRHYPLSHFNAASIVRNQLENLGIKITEENYVMSHPNKVGDPTSFNRMFGLLTLDARSFNLEDQDKMWAPTIGITNSHDKSIGYRVLGGSNTFVCSNLCIYGDYQVRRKHTRNMLDDLPYMVLQLLNEVVKLPEFIAGRNERWRNTTLLPSDADTYLVEAVRRNIIPATKIIEVSDEFRNPNYDYGFGDEHTLYHYHEAFTATALRPTTANGLVSSSKHGPELTKMLDTIMVDNLIENTSTSKEVAIA